MSKTLTYLFFFSFLLISANGFSQRLSISQQELEDKIYASWLGQIIGNIYGIPHENVYIDEPGADNFPYGYGENLKTLREMGGGYSDDDTDFEYMYLILMEKYGTEPTYQQITDAWKYHVRNRVWVANRAALGLMHHGLTPPATGMQEFNPHWFQIDPQLINEIWAVTAPGMIQYAVEKSDWAARITNEGWGVEPTLFYGVLYSAAFFENDIHKLIDLGAAYLPENGRFRKTIEDVKRWHSQYPQDWKAARRKLYEEYYLNEPEETRSKWNAIVNGACAVMALLYGDGDFQYTLDLSCAIGFDADNQAATLCGLFGVMNGVKGLPKELLFPIPEWDLPFNDTYKNVTRHDLPDAKLTDIAQRTTQQAEKIILANGGKKENSIYTINPEAHFYAPLELCQAPFPVWHIGENISYNLPVSGIRGKAEWKITGGKLPAGIQLTDGKLSGVSYSAGEYPVEFTVSTPGGTASRKTTIRIYPHNLSSSATEILVSPVSSTTTPEKTLAPSFYASSPEALRDGITYGEKSILYGIGDMDTRATPVYFGYQWSSGQEIGHISFHTGSVENSGGWFANLHVQYLTPQGEWMSVGNLDITPELAHPTNIYEQPHFIDYFISFTPVQTKGIRIVGQPSPADYWNKKPRNTPPFVTITELGVYNSFLK